MQEFSDYDYFLNERSYDQVRNVSLEVFFRLKARIWNRQTIGIPLFQEKTNQIWELKPLRTFHLGAEPNAANEEANRNAGTGKHESENRNWPAELRSQWTAFQRPREREKKNTIGKSETKRRTQAYEQWTVKIQGGAYKNEWKGKGID